MGGGRKFYKILREFGGVSNPLGWEGDRIVRLFPGRAAFVSNPLGWEGDAIWNQKSTIICKVSNPLGWEGDLNNQEIELILKRFLIH